MIVPPGETGVGHLHTKESETPGTENEAKIEQICRIFIVDWRTRFPTPVEAFAEADSSAESTFPFNASLLK